MSNTLYTHTDCGGKIEIYASEVWCNRCGFVAAPPFPNTLTDEFEEWLPILIQEEIVPADPLSIPGVVVNTLSENTI